MSEENKLYFKAEKEAIFLLLTGIGDENYSTVDACNTAMRCDSNERLKQRERISKICTPCKVFQELYKTYQQQLSNYLQTPRNKTKIPHQGIYNDNQSGHFGIKRTMKVAGARKQ
ncbi:hypothetical protein Tco_0711052 [Tanacetum coccineum]